MFMPFTNVSCSVVDKMPCSSTSVLLQSSIPYFDDKDCHLIGRYLQENDDSSDGYNKINLLYSMMMRDKKHLKWAKLYIQYPRLSSLHVATLDYSPALGLATTITSMYHTTVVYFDPYVKVSFADANSFIGICISACNHDCINTMKQHLYQSMCSIFNITYTKKKVLDLEKYLLDTGYSNLGFTASHPRDCGNIYSYDSYPLVFNGANSCYVLCDTPINKISGDHSCVRIGSTFTLCGLFFNTYIAKSKEVFRKFYDTIVRSIHIIGKVDHNCSCSDVPPLDLSRFIESDYGFSYISNVVMMDCS